MAAYGTESIPTTWDDERDTAFFGITASLFSCEFAYGAGVLLASYDEEMETAVTSNTNPIVTTTTSPAATNEHVHSR